MGGCLGLRDVCRVGLWGAEDDEFFGDAAVQAFLSFLVVVFVPSWVRQLLSQVGY